MTGKALLRTNKPMLPDRRSFLYGLGATLGASAFTSLLHGAGANNPLVPRKGHHPARAKRCIFLYMAGGPSHIDTFDPKPELTALDGKLFQNNDRLTSNMARGERRYVGTPFEFRQHGSGDGIWMCDRFEHLPSVADDLCIYRGCQGESVNHPTANPPHEHGEPLRRRPRSRGLDELRARHREPEPPRLRRPPRRLLPAGRSRELVERLPARPPPGDAAPFQGLAHPRPLPAGGRPARDRAAEPRPPRRVRGRARRRPPRARLARGADA